MIKYCWNYFRQTSFEQTDVNRIRAFVNLLQTPDSVEATIKVKGKNTVVPAGCIVEVPCKANIGNLWQTQPMTFQQEETELGEQVLYSATWIAQTVFLWWKRVLIIIQGSCCE